MGWIGSLDFHLSSDMILMTRASKSITMLRLFCWTSNKSAMATLMKKPTSVSEHFLWSTKMENYLYKFYKIIMCCPVSIVYTSTGLKVEFQKSTRLWGFVVIVFVFIYISVLFISRLILPFTLHVLSAYSASMNIMLIFTMCLTSLTESQFLFQFFIDFLYLKQKTERDMLMLCRELFEREKFLYIKNYVRLLLAVQIFPIFVETVIMLRSDNLYRFYSSWLILPRLFIRFRCLQHRLYTGTLHTYIKLIRLKIEECIGTIDKNEFMARQQNRHEFTMNSRRLFNDLNLSMRLFTSVYRMTYLVNKMFGWSLLVLFFEIFIHLITNLFWIYSKLIRQDFYTIPGLNLFFFMKVV